MIDKEYWLKLWKSVKDGENVLTDRYSICTVSVCAELEDAKDLLRRAPNDYIYMRGGRSKTGHLCEGLLCVEGIRSLADVDTMFFAGNIDGKDNIYSINELETVMTDQARYLIGTVLLLSQEVAEKIQLSTISEALIECFGEL